MRIFKERREYAGVKPEEENVPVQTVLIPASNEPSQLADFVPVLARTVGECREGAYPQFAAYSSYDAP